jgi:hypothetical protein
MRFVQNMNLQTDVNKCVCVLISYEEFAAMNYSNQLHNFVCVPSAHICFYI